MAIYIRTTGARLGPAGIGMAALLLMIGGAIVLSSLALLLALGAVAAAVGAGIVLVRRITGRGAPSVKRGQRLDPSLEVFPIEPASGRPLGPGMEPRVGDSDSRPRRGETPAPRDP